MRQIIQALIRTCIDRKRVLTLVVAMALPTIGAAIPSGAGANGVPFAKGDVLADVGGGLIRHFSPAGTLLDTLNTTTGTIEGDGMCFDVSGNLYATQGFEANTMSKFDSGGNLLVAEFGSGFNEHPESCVFNSANDMYVGQPDGEKHVLKFDTSGKLLASFAPEPENRGTDWLDLASDQCTLHYTSEGGAVKQFNVCTNTQLPDFATGLPSTCYAHRILPDGGELVACTSTVVRLDATGKAIQTYEPEPSGFLFALNLDPDGVTFWTAGYISGTIYQINIATGNVVKSFSAGEVHPLGGIAVVGELTCSEAAVKLAPLTGEDKVGAKHTVTATVSECGKAVSGKVVHFTVTGVNPQTGEGTTNEAGEATFTYTGEHAGEDHIVASATVKEKVEESNTVEETWTTGAKEECTKAIGEGRFRVGNEAQFVVNNVSTNLASKQAFVFTWGFGSHHVRLTKLTAASCVATATKKSFHGSGTAKLDGVSGYHIGFSITVMSKGKLIVTVSITKGKELVAKYIDSALTGETVS
jgi:hypothetical protein